MRTHKLAARRLRPGKWERPVTPIHAVRRTLRKSVDFWRTRRAVLRGQPVYDYVSEELVTQRFLGPWTFNLLQSSFVFAIYSLIMGVGQLLGWTTPDYDTGLFGSDNYRANNVYAKTHAWLQGLIVPYGLLLLAKAAAWASREPSRDNTSQRRRVMRAYLYLEGADGFWPELLTVSGLALVSIRPGDDTLIADSLNSVLLAIGLLAALAGVLWAAVVLGFLLPIQLFTLNGYKPGPLLSKYPWLRYWSVMGLALPLLTLLAAILLEGLSHGIARLLVRP